MPNTPVRAAAEGMPADEYPMTKVMRLAHELGDALDLITDLPVMVEIYPRGSGYPRVGVYDVQSMSDTAEARLQHHAQGFQKAVRDIDPAITEWKFDGTRFALIGSRKTAS